MASSHDPTRAAAIDRATGKTTRRVPLAEVIATMREQAAGDPALLAAIDEAARALELKQQPAGEVPVYEIDRPYRSRTAQYRKGER